MTTRNEGSTASAGKDDGARNVGFILIAVSLLAVLLMAHHPTASTHDATALAADIDGKSALSRFVHGGLIALLGVQVFAFSVLCRRLGFERNVVRAGFVAYAIGAGAMIGAALISGFIVADLAAHYAQATPSEADTFVALLRLSMTGNQALANLGVFAMSAAITSWAIALIGERRDAWIVALGLLAGVVPAVMLAIGTIRLDVHGMLLVVVLETAWNLAAGVYLIRDAR